jgi:HD-GYP domain-containing protein (c-di-GMP phosphodiesterase class II)
MTSILLKYPVTGIHGERIAERGISVCPDTIETITPPNTRVYEQVSFIDYGSVRTHIIELLNSEPYNRIFKPEDIDRIFTVMTDIRLPAPVMETIYYFKEFDYYTFRHFLMVFSLTSLLSMELLNDRDLCIRNIKAGTSHDIGKLCIPESILKKSTALTQEEKEDLKQHTLAGYILTRYYYNHTEHHVARAALNHHERQDGSGYPFGIALDDFVSDIIVVSDVFDALISTRPYRPSPYDTRSALDVITVMANENKINRNVVKALINFTRGNKIHYSRCDISQDMRGKPPEGNLYDKRED